MSKFQSGTVLLFQQGLTDWQHEQLGGRISCTSGHFSDRQEPSEARESKTTRLKENDMVGGTSMPDALASLLPCIFRHARNGSEIAVSLLPSVVNVRRENSGWRASNLCRYLEVQPLAIIHAVPEFIRGMSASNERRGKCIE